MARGVQLTQLIDKLRAECRHASSSAAGVDYLDTLKEILRRVQETLYDDYDWPHMRVRRTIAMVAGQRFYDFPVDLNIERLEAVERKWSGSYEPIARGITFEDFNSHDSLAATPERADPVDKWDVFDDGDGEQIEVWPIPAASGSTLLLTGIRNLNALTAMSDVADLDDRMIVLFAAAEILAAQKANDAQAKLASAQQRFARLKGRFVGADSGVTVIGGGGAPRSSRDGPRIVRVS